MKREILELREVIGKLVPLLTGKGLTVTQRGSEAFVKVDPKTKKPFQVNIPNISDNATPDFIRAIQGFIDHEVAHVLITNWDDYLVKGDPSNPKVKRLQILINIVEDTMIEREIVRIFPGSRKNIADMRQHFIEKITKPAVEQAKDDREKFQYLLVAVMRALAGHEEFQNYMDHSKSWDIPIVKEFVDKLSKQTKEMLPKINQTRQSRQIAEELETILHPPAPKPVVQSVEPDEGSTTGGDMVVIKGTGFIDVVNVAFGANPATWCVKSPTEIIAIAPPGEEGLTSVTVTNLTDSHTLPDCFTYVEMPLEEQSGGESQCQSGNDGEGDASQDQPGQSDKGKGSSSAGDEDEDSDGDEGNGSGAGDEDSGESDGQSAETDGDDSDESDGDNGDDAEDGENGAGDSGDQDEDEGEGEGDDGDDAEDGDDQDDAGAGDQDEGEGDDESDGDEDDASSSAGHEDDENDGGDDDSEDESDGKQEKRGDTVAFDTGDHRAGSSGREDSFEGGGGVGGDGSSGRSLLEFEDDAFESADVSSQITIFITNEAVESISKSDYTVFTREFDRIEPLDPPKSMDSKWVPELEEATRQMVSRMQKDIERMMASQSHIIRTPGWRSGRLHAPALHRLKTGDDRVFNRRQEHKSKDTAVTLLIDNSGSMAGAKIWTAMVAGYALSSTLERVNIANEVLGFTTTNWWGIPATVHEGVQKELNKHGIRYSRTIPLVMPIFKSFEERVTPTVKQRIAFVQRAQQGLQGNVDGECLEYAAIRLMKRREKRKVMIVLSDGHPVNAENARGHLKMVVESLNKSGIETIGIGIMDDAVRAFYPKHVVLNNIEELPGQVMQELRQILSN